MGGNDDLILLLILSGVVGIAWWYSARKPAAPAAPASTTEPAQMTQPSRTDTPWAAICVLAFVFGVVGNFVARWMSPEETKSGHTIADEVDSLQSDVWKVARDVDSLESDVSSLRSELRSHDH